MTGKIPVGPFWRRKPHRTAKTVYVKRHLRPDRGKKGKIPKRLQWSKKIKHKPSHKIEGYQIGLPLQKRHTLLNKEVRERSKYGAARYKSLNKTEEGALSTKRTLIEKQNLNPSRKAKSVFKQDRKFIERKYKI